MTALRPGVSAGMKRKKCLRRILSASKVRWQGLLDAPPLFERDDSIVICVEAVEEVVQLLRGQGNARTGEGRAKLSFGELPVLVVVYAGEEAAECLVGMSHKDSKILSDGVSAAKMVRGFMSHLRIGSCRLRRDRRASESRTEDHRPP